MELLQLDYFRELAQVGNMTLAAERLGISQPTLSRAISRLEKGLGVSLFDRHGKKLALNRFGRAFLGRTEASLAELECGKQELSDLKGSGRRDVTIGSASARLLPGPLIAYLAKHPEGQFRILQIMDSQELETQIRNGDIDIGISFEPIDNLEIHCEALTVEEIFLAVSPRHPLAQRPHVTLTELSHETFIALTSECGLRSITDGFCRRAGFLPDIAFEVNSLDVISSLVNADLGIAFLPGFWGRGKSGEHPLQKPFRPPCLRTVWVAWAGRRYAPVKVSEFRNFLISYYAQLSRRDSRSP